MLADDCSPLAKDQRKYLSKLDGKIVLVLGGTSGIGFCVAEAAVEHNAQVIVASSSAEKVQKAVHRLRTAYPSRATNIHGKTCNLGDPKTVETELKALFEFAGRGIAHIAVTAGDRVTVKPIAEASVKFTQNPNAVRYIVPMMLAKIAPAYLLPGPESSISFTGSVSSTMPIPGRGIMSALAASLEDLMRGMAHDLKPVRVNFVRPWTVHTEMYDSLPKEVAEFLFELAGEQTLGGAIGRPEDVAEAYLYLMKDRFITGTVITSDGGNLLM